MTMSIKEKIEKIQLEIASVEEQLDVLYSRIDSLRSTCTHEKTTEEVFKLNNMFDLNEMVKRITCEECGHSAYESVNFTKG